MQVTARGAALLADRRGGRGRRVAPGLVGFAALITLVGGVVARPSVAQDVAVRDAAVEGYQTATGGLDAVVRVHRLERYGSCAVVELEGGLSGYATVGLLREHGEWTYRGSLEGDADDAGSEELCLDLVRDARPGPP